MEGIQLESLNMSSTEDIDFEEMFVLEDDINHFQQNDLVKEALAKGVDLDEYAKEVDKDLKETAKASVQDYIRESNSLAQIHTKIRGCDGTLQSVESLLTGFSSDLVTINHLVRHLQEASFAINVKVKNRKALEKKLNKYIDKVVIPPDLITKVCDSEVNEAYQDYLVELSEKIESIESVRSQGTASVEDIVPLIERLKMKAVSKVREFFLLRLERLKEPRTNLAIIQQNSLLKFSYLMQFVAKNWPDAYMEVRDTYADMMSRIYSMYFQRYLNNIAKLEIELGRSKNALLAADEKELGAERRNVFSRGHNMRHQLFSLGERIQALRDVEDASPIVPHMAAQAGLKYTYEFIFRSITRLLMDTCTGEYMFCYEFFGKSRELCHAVFHNIIHMLQEYVQSYVQTCWDSIGLLLLIRITYHLHLIMSNRGVPVLDHLFDSFNLMFWPRFKLVFDANLDSLRNPDNKKLANDTLNPHYITRRYAEYSAAIVTLSRDHEDEAIKTGLQTLRFEMSKVIALLAAEHGLPARKMVFRINNYDVILSVYAKFGLGKSEDERHFAEELEHQMVLLVDEELCSDKAYSRLILLVKRNDAPIRTGKIGPDNLPSEFASQVESVAKEFTLEWRKGKGVEKVRADVKKLFTANLDRGRDLLQRAALQLIEYYRRFQDDVVKKCFRRPGFEKDLMNINTLKYDLQQVIQSY